MTKKFASSIVLLCLALTTRLFVVYAESTSCTKQNRGDADCNGIVNLSDFEVYREEFGSFEEGLLNPSLAKADFNGDGKVNLSDFERFRSGFIESNGPGELPTPSPSPTPTEIPTPSVNPSPTIPTKPPTPTPTRIIKNTIDASTMDRKFMMGYQGWFQCPMDGSPDAGWHHWFNDTPPKKPVIDAWPNTAELTESERCNTGLKFPDGRPAYLYSAYHEQTVLRHFQWMEQNNLDGVMLQRFTTELSNTSMFKTRNQVAHNVKSGAEQTGRVFNIMYDISGPPESTATLVATIENDWKYLVDTEKLTASPRYLKQNKRPLIVLWGFGFSDRPGTPADLLKLIDFFHNNPEAKYRATVMGGVNNDWRTNTTWKDALGKFDVISPWMVGRISNLDDADSYKKITASELAFAKSRKQLYMPVIFPGYSWHNGTGTQPINQIPRLGGNFLWRQAYNDLSAGATMLYGAMFDEVNEGTALYKMAPTANDWPSDLEMVPVLTDGYSQLPSDWYLKVSGEITKMVHRKIPVSSKMIITPK